MANFMHYVKNDYPTILLCFVTRNTIARWILANGYNMSYFSRKTVAMPSYGKPIHFIFAKRNVALVGCKVSELANSELKTLQPPDWPVGNESRFLIGSIDSSIFLTGP